MEDTTEHKFLTQREVPKMVCLVFRTLVVLPPAYRYDVMDGLHISGQISVVIQA